MYDFLQPDLFELKVSQPGIGFRLDVSEDPFIRFDEIFEETELEMKMWSDTYSSIWNYKVIWVIYTFGLFIFSYEIDNFLMTDDDD